MLALWLALAPTLAAETIPTEELADHLDAVRTASGEDKLAIGYAGYDNEDRLAPIVEPLDFVVAKRLPASAEPDKAMKGVLRKAKSKCGFMITGGGRTTTLHAVGECASAVSEDEAWIAECRKQGLAATYPEGEAARIELLRPTLPKGMEREAWESVTAHLATAFAACAAESEAGLPEESRLTVKLAWDAEGKTQPAELTIGGAPDALRTCAIRVGSCLPDVAAADEARAINQVIRILEAQEAPPVEQSEGEEADEAEGEDGSEGTED